MDEERVSREEIQEGESVPSGEIAHEEKGEIPSEEKKGIPFNEEALINHMKKEIEELKDKYKRLYAEFENYKRMVAKEKEEIIKYSNEALINALIPSLDNLEMAVKHAEEVNSGLVEGVKLTLREILRVLEKAGLTQIDSYMKPFDPVYHEAMSMVEREDLDELTVVEEFRKGYIYKDKVLRPSLVAVSKKPDKKEGNSSVSE
ncbi:MAG: nucleotide exchange factor GrpE [Thermodesulfovibrionales bacterium]|nr:nucleotide exchange factor GrpE [Thermodesulfovibrionales bacterium]